MRVSFFLFALACCSFLIAQNQSQERIEQVISNSYQKIWTELNQNEIANFYAVDALLFENGKLFTRDSIPKKIQNTIQLYHTEGNKQHSFARNFRFDFVKIQIDGDLAVISYFRNEEFKMDGISISSGRYFETTSMQQDNNKWKITVVHSTKISD